MLWNFWKKSANESVTPPKTIEELEFANMTLEGAFAKLYRQAIQNQNFHIEAWKRQLEINGQLLVAVEELVRRENERNGVKK
jgi:hypothetical protein